MNQEIRLMSTSVSYNSSGGFTWKEYYLVKIVGDYPLQMEVEKLCHPREGNVVNLRIFLRDNTTLFEQSGDSLDGTVLGNAKKFLANFLTTQIQLTNIFRSK